MPDTKPSLIEYAGTTGGRDYTRGFVGAIHKWLPSQDSLLQQKSGGDLELYESIIQDDQVKSCLQQRFRALLAKDWEVIPGGDKRSDKQAAEHLEKQLEAINWDNCNEKMLFGIHYGYSAAEIMWERQDDKVGIAAIKVRNRRRFHFNDEQKLVLKTMQNPLGEDLPERKFWHFCTGADHDDEPYGRGLGHWLYWPTFFKRNGVRWWLKFVEKYAQPTRLGKYPAGATDNEKSVLWDALGSFGDDARSMIPEGLEMEFLESSRAGTVDYKSLCDQMDGAIAKIILSQTMTTDDGSSLSQASVHESVKDEVIESDSDLLCESFNNSVAVWLTDWNYPGAAYPKVRRKIQADPDPATMADTDTKLQGLGISLKPEAIAAKYGEDYLVPDNADSIPQLNGEQVNALVSIITNAKQGGWSAELVAGMINGAFPNWPDDAVSAITKNLGDPTGGVGQIPDPNSQTPTPNPKSLDEIATEFAMSDLEVEFKIAEGTVKEKNGKKYVLTNSRWKLADKPEKKPTTKKPLTDTQKAKKEKIVKDSGVKPVAPKAEKKPSQETKPEPIDENLFDSLFDEFDLGTPPPIGGKNLSTVRGADIPSDAKEIGRGMFGVAYLGTDGSIYKENFKKDSNGNEEILKIQNMAADLGIAPRVSKATESLIVMEQAQGLTIMQLEGKRGYKKASEEALKAVMKMHKAGIVHRDLHSENIMYSKEHGISLIDFGSAGVVPRGSRSKIDDLEIFFMSHPMENSALANKVRAATRTKDGGAYEKFLEELA